MTLRPFTRRTALATGAALATTAALTSCGAGGEDSETLDKIENLDDNINAEGMPIADEKITIDFLSARPSTTAEDWTRSPRSRRPRSSRTSTSISAWSRRMGRPSDGNRPDQR